MVFGALAPPAPVDWLLSESTMNRAFRLAGSLAALLVSAT